MRETEGAGGFRTGEPGPRCVAGFGNPRGRVSIGRDGPCVVMSFALRSLMQAAHTTALKKGSSLNPCASPSRPQCRHFTFTDISILSHPAGVERRGDSLSYLPLFF